MSTELGKQWRSLVKEMRMLNGTHSYRFYVFYATLLYGEYTSFKELRAADLPDGVYLYEPEDKDGDYWFLKDLTPVLPEDVPKELKALCLIMGI